MRRALVWLLSLAVGCGGSGSGNEPGGDGAADTTDGSTSSDATTTAGSSSGGGANSSTTAGGTDASGGSSADGTTGGSGGSGSESGSGGSGTAGASGSGAGGSGGVPSVEGWTTPERLAPDSGFPTTPRLAADADGNVFVAWTQTVGAQTTVWVNRYDAAAQAFEGVVSANSRRRFTQPLDGRN